MDRQATPVNPALPGMEVHANFIADAFAGSFMKRVPPWLEILVALAGASAASFLLLFRKKVFELIGISALILFPIAASLLLFNRLYFFNPMPALISELSACVAVVVLEYRSEGRQRAYLRRAFAQYVSNDVISVLVNQPEKLSLGGESRIITTLFSDLEGFTHVSEVLGAEQLARFMNLYLGIISEEILAQGGTLDKYGGDAVVAFWNAPLNMEDHAARALAAAVQIQKRMSDASQSFEQEFGIIPRTRIGIATGLAVVGNLGSSARFAYTAVGDSVNIASRLEAANKTVGTSMLTMRDTVAAAVGNEKISLSTERVSFNLAGDESVSLRKLGPAIVQGKTQPIELWAIEDDFPQPWSETRQLPK
jgi:adenylate cyclase